MQKKIIGFLWFMILAVSIGSYALGESEMQIPLTSSTSYENSSLYVNVDFSIEVFENSSFLLIDDETGKEITRSEITWLDETSRFYVRASGLKPGKLYLLRAKYVKVLGKYESSYDMGFICQYPKDTYGLKPIYGNILSEQWVEIYFSQPIKPAQFMANQLTLQMANEKESFSLSNRIQVQGEARPQYRVLFKMIDDHKFEYDKSYTISVSDELESIYGTKGTSNWSDVTLYRLKQKEELFDAKLSWVENDTLEFFFNKDIVGEPLVIVYDLAGNEKNIENYEISSDENDRKTVLTVKMENEIFAGEQIYIAGVQSLVDEEQFEKTFTIKETETPTTFKIVSTEITSPVTMSITTNKRIDPLMLKYMNVKIYAEGQVTNKAVDVHSIWIDDEDPMNLELYTGAGSVFKEDVAYTIVVEGTVADIYGAIYNVMQKTEVLPEIVGRVKFSADALYYLDDKHIYCRWSLPTFDTFNYNSELRVVRNPQHDNEMLRIEDVEVINSRVWIIELEKSSVMYDTYIVANEIFDMTGRFELTIQNEISSPWD